MKNGISRHTPNQISHQEHQSSLIRSPNERSELNSEIARSFQASLMNDIVVERKKTLKEAEEKKTPEERQHKALKLPEKRKLRVQKEPNNSEKTVNLAVRHPELGMQRRQFREDSTMNCVYDWIGSLSPEPVYFGLFMKFHSDPVLPSADVKLYDKTILNVGVLADPIDFQEDKETTMYGYSNMSNMEILETKRNSEKDALINDNSVFLVDRLNVVANMFSIYQDAQVTKSLMKINFRGEDATGHGVTRDVYSQFYKEIFRFHSSGIHANVPSSLSETESERFGKILTHAYILYNIFPIEIATAFFEQLVKGEVRNDIPIIQIVCSKK